MKLLILTDSYPPEIRSSSILMHELAQGLRDRGHQVAVLTCYPAYNLTDSDRERFRDHRSMRDRTEEGIRVLRARAWGVHDTGPLLRGLSQLSLPPIFAHAARRLGMLDGIIQYSPPLTLGLAAAWLARRTGARFVMNVQDLIPEILIKLGKLRNPALVALLRAIERTCYRRADAITCHSEGNLAWLRSQVTDPTKVSIVHNWIRVEDYQVPPDPRVRRDLDLEGRFVLIFAGVMGIGQDLGVIVRAARLLRDREDIAFLLIGDGVERATLEQEAADLEDVRFHPFIAREDYPGWLAAADVGLVTLKPNHETPAVPSKILGYMAAAKPWIASLPPASDGRVIAEESGSGLLAKPGDPASVAEAVLALREAPERARSMGEAGRIYCRRHFDREACIDRYHEILTDGPRLGNSPQAP